MTPKEIAKQIRDMTFADWLTTPQGTFAQLKYGARCMIYFDYYRLHGNNKKRRQYTAEQWMDRSHFEDRLALRIDNYWIDRFENKIKLNEKLAKHMTISDWDRHYGLLLAR